MPGPRAAFASVVIQGTLWTIGGRNYYKLGEYSNEERRYGDVWKNSGGQWGWMAGDTTPAQQPIYGTKYTPSPNNNIGNKAFISVWYLDNKIWLYGGEDWIQKRYAALWTYDLNTNEFTWMGGHEYLSPVYTAVGTASPVNYPGSRAFGASWVSSDGTMWLFGGGLSTWNSNNELWKFDGNLWTLVKEGTSTSIRGAEGEYGASFTPSPRIEFVYTNKGDKLYLIGEDFINDTMYYCTWIFDSTSQMWSWIDQSAPPRQYGGVFVDSDDNIFYFGGYSTEGIIGNTNDFWKWNKTHWILLQGNGSDSNDLPSARNQFTFWTDNFGVFWIFGGLSSAGFINDIWKYEGGMWTRMGHGNEESQGVYSLDSYAYPSGRIPPLTLFNPATNRMTLVGGYGLGLVYDFGFSFSSTGVLADIWEWNGTMWTWLYGDQTLQMKSNYNTSFEVMTIGGHSNGFGWVVNGTGYIYGGVGYGSSNFSVDVLSDLWKTDLESFPRLLTPVGDSTTSQTTPLELTTGITSGSLTTSPVTSSTITTSLFTTDANSVTSSLVTTSPITTSVDSISGSTTALNPVVTTALTPVVTTSAAPLTTGSTDLSINVVQVTNPVNPRFAVNKLLLNCLVNV